MFALRSGFPDAAEWRVYEGENFGGNNAGFGVPRGFRGTFLDGVPVAVQ